MFGLPHLAREAALRTHYEALAALNFTKEWVAANPIAFSDFVTRSMQVCARFPPRMLLLAPPRLMLNSRLCGAG